MNVAGVDLVADLSGALFWEEQSLLVVSDLHLEKGSSFAARGVLLPPYDTVATLGRLAAVIARHDPRMVIALGDSFHDRDAHARLSAPDRDAIAALQARRDWIWISGNHDPALTPDLGGVVAHEVAIGPIAFRHEPTGASGEIAGHLHPKARVSTRGRSMERRCFACDGERAVMPAFGAYTGGLSIRDAAFAKIFQTLSFMAHVLGDVRLHTIAASRMFSISYSCQSMSASIVSAQDTAVPCLSRLRRVGALTTHTGILVGTPTPPPQEREREPSLACGELRRLGLNIVAELGQPIGEPKRCGAGSDRAAAHAGLIESCCPSPGPEASLIREPQDKRQSNSEPSHVLVAETPDLLPDPFASQGDRLVGHHLRFEPQSIFGLGLDGDAKIRSVHQFGSQLADHH